MKLDDIGFYTIKDARAKSISGSSPIARAEFILTDRCNFKCIYCRGIPDPYKGDADITWVKAAIHIMSKWGLDAVRFSGGEPTMHKGLIPIVEYCKNHGVQHIAVSTNGSADWELYRSLIFAGVNDFSVSLDACCSEFGNLMSGTDGYWKLVVRNLGWIATLAYTTVGIVVTEENASQLVDIIKFVGMLNVSDIRIVPAAQYAKILSPINMPDIPARFLNAFPLLRYRINRMKMGFPIRSLSKVDSDRCYLVQDDLAIAGKHHFPCIIYLREGGEPIGKMNVNFREERCKWFSTHNVKEDKICRENCLDVCVDFNNVCKVFDESS